MALNPNNHRLGLAGGFDGVGGGKPPAVAASSPRHPDESLTQKYNRHAKGLPSGMPPSKRQIKALKNLLSQPRPGHNLTTLGTINNSCKPTHDRTIMSKIEEIQQQLDLHKGKAKTDFAKGQAKHTAKKAFNRSSGMGM